MFASRDYDPFAIDLWALGCTLSELFRPFASPKTETATAADDSDDSEEDSFERAYRQYATPEPEPKPARQTLFDASLSEFVLAASIFRVLGTPTLETWPVNLLFSTKTALCSRADEPLGARRKRRTCPTFRGSRSRPFRPRRSSPTSPISTIPRSQTCSLDSSRFRPASECRRQKWSRVSHKRKPELENRYYYRMISTRPTEVTTPLPPPKWRAGRRAAV